VEKYGIAWQATDYTIIRRMRLAFLITKFTHKHTHTHHTHTPHTHTRTHTTHTHTTHTPHTHTHHTHTTHTHTRTHTHTHTPHTHTHTLSFCSTYCLTTVTVVVQTRLNALFIRTLSILFAYDIVKLSSLNRNMFY